MLGYEDHFQCPAACNLKTAAGSPSVAHAMRIWRSEPFLGPSRWSPPSARLDGSGTKRDVVGPLAPGSSRATSWAFHTARLFLLQNRPVTTIRQ
jgi:hypothetical protein